MSTTASHPVRSCLGCGRPLRPTFRHCPGCGAYCGLAAAQAGSSAVVLRGLRPLGLRRRRAA